jgi:iron complex transport system substrate-binding protein
MNKRVTIALVLVLIIVGSTAAILLNQNWFNKENEPTQNISIGLTLEVFGNANMDDIVDNEDIDYLNMIINGTKTETQFADANKDGSIDQNDIQQVTDIINGDATYIVLLDGNEEPLTVTLPVNRIVIEYLSNAELIRALKLEDKVVGVDYAVDRLKSFYFPENTQNLVCVGKMNTPDYEAVLNVNPDVLLTFTKDTAEKAEKLPGVVVIFLGMYYPNVTAPEDSSFVQGILKAGYIFDRVSESREYVDWLLDLTETIRAGTENLAENEKPTVFITNYPYDTTATTVSCYATVDTLGQACILSGGANVGQSLSGYLNSSSVQVDAEWIIEANPEYMFLHTVRYTFGGAMRDDPAQGYDVDSPTSIQNCLAEYLAKPEFADITAVKNGHVYIIA